MNVYHGFYFDTDKEPYVAVIMHLITCTMGINHCENLIYKEGGGIF